MYDKGSKRFERRILRKVCSEVNFYALPNYDDPHTKGIIWQQIKSSNDPGQLESLTEEQFIEIGKQPLDLNIIESLQLSAIDGGFARLIPRLRDRNELSQADKDVLLNFLTLARYRTPVWRKVYYPLVYKDISDHWQQFVQQARITGQFPPEYKSNNEFDIEIERSLFQLAIVQASTRDMSALRQVSARVMVLHTTGRYKFVTCDNPARPYYPNWLRQITDDDLPGIKDPKAQITFPVSPDTCILVSTNQDLPNFGHEEVGEKQIKRINTALALMADSEIVLPNPSLYHFEPWLDLSRLQPLKNP